jgi:hypothetical protein
VDTEFDLAPDLQRKVNDVRGKGGIEAVRISIERFSEAFTRNKEMLNKSDRMLKEVDPTILSNERKIKYTKLSVMIAKQRELIYDTLCVQEDVRQKIENNCNGLELLSKSTSHLREMFRAFGVDVSGSFILTKLETLGDALSTISLEIQSIETELNANSFDIREQILHALTAGGTIEASDASRFLKESIQPFQQKISENIKQQHALICEISEAHQKFRDEFGSEISQRNHIVEKIKSAYESFQDVYSNLKVGQDWNKNLAKNFIVLENQISEFCDEPDFKRKDTVVSTAENTQMFASPQMFALPPMMHPQFMHAQFAPPPFAYPQLNPYQAPQMPSATIHVHTGNSGVETSISVPPSNKEKPVNEESKEKERNLEDMTQDK